MSLLTKTAYVGQVLRAHIWRWWLGYLLMAMFGCWFHAHYRFALNLSASLPNTWFLVSLDARPSKVGDYIAFQWDRNEFYSPHWMFVKRVGGVSGQTVSVKGRSVFVDGRWVGDAKPVSKYGTPLEVTAGGVIPQGAFYVEAPNPNSLDSRYAVTGLVESPRVMGKAYVLF